ncbi:bifunctional glutamate N-acetyltransferase/amino-acid acetyltransferase ArgJ [Candidatus Pelagibacter sp.]|nr:bifunctional glutamate N-acetyltransferase/amino-acid acetyltransferase ArgJ [Candidatus Pelagibacter sp.]
MLFKKENYQIKTNSIGFYQDLEHIDGIGISAVSANLYEKKNRDELVIFYFRKGANHATVYTQSQIKSENIKWNIKNSKEKIFSLLINTRNANAFTGKEGYKSINNIASILSESLTKKQSLDEEEPKKIKVKNLLFASTGTIGEQFPEKKISDAIPKLIQNIKYVQNRYVWMKAAMGILTTDTRPKLSMEECKIGGTPIKIYGIAKGSGMIHPDMATTLGFIFTDAKISGKILKQLLKKNIQNTFNAISCDGDTSTNDMVSIFSTGYANNREIRSYKDKILNEFDTSLNNVLKNLAKSVAADGEGASKFVIIKVEKCKNENDAKKICFSIANSPLVKTAIAGEDPNWGRIIMAIGKTKIKINLDKLNINIGPHKIIENGKLSSTYKESDVAEYMQSLEIKINVQIGNGNKDFEVYTMDLTKKYIEINSDYRS